MNHSDIRKYLKQGEQAVDVLKSLGYVYVANGKEHPHWVAPVQPLDPIMEALKDLASKMSAETLKQETAKAYLAGEQAGLVKGDQKGPRWDTVKDLAGKKFSVMRAKIPGTNKLSEYGPVHFLGKQFTCEEIRYYRSDVYTGYAVMFRFELRAFHPEVVWLPLSACAFSK